MEKIRLLINTMAKMFCLLALLAGVNIAAQAQHVSLSISSVTIGQGQEVALPVVLANGDTEICGGQFTVTLPQGIEVKDVVLNTARSNGHVLEYKANSSENRFMVLFYAQPTAPLAGAGELCTLMLSARSDAPSGTFPVTLSDVRLASDATTQINATATDGTVTILSQYNVIVSATEGGTVQGGGLFNAGTMVTLTATANEGYRFEQWSDGSTSNPYTFEAKADVNVTAKFVPEHYIVTYMIDGAIYKTEEVAYGSEIPVPDVPEKEGHTFSGWSEVPETMPAKDVTVTGSYKTNIYKVTYILDGEVFKVEEVAYGTVVPTPEVPAKEGYNFSGWGEVPETMPAKDITLTGSYTINKDLKYNLIYMVDGIEYKRVTFSFGDVIVLEDEPVKEGYTFSGWSEVPETMPMHDVTVTGSFTANSYTLTYMLDGEVFRTETVVFGTAITEPEVPVKEGYTFSGWSEMPETMPAKDVTVIGSYTINSYTLTYMVDGDIYKTYELEYGASITAETEPTKEGHTFSGWSEVPEKMPARNVTVTGSFAINSYTLTYMVDGDIYKTYELEYGASITAEAEPTKEGYTFSGWSEVPETMPAEDVTVTGTYIVNVYKAIYILDGEIFKTENVAYGNEIPLPEVPEKDGYIFTGWENVPETMPAYDIVLMGKYEKADGVDSPSADQIVKVTYFSVTGKASQTPYKGMNIVKMEYTNGTVRVIKQLME